MHSYVLCLLVFREHGIVCFLGMCARSWRSTSVRKWRQLPQVGGDYFPADVMVKITLGCKQFEQVVYITVSTELEYQENHCMLPHEILII